MELVYFKDFWKWDACLLKLLQREKHDGALFGGEEARISGRFAIEMLIVSEGRWEGMSNWMTHGLEVAHINTHLRISSPAHRCLPKTAVTNDYIVTCETSGMSLSSEPTVVVVVNLEDQAMSIRPRRR